MRRVIRHPILSRIAFRHLSHFSRLSKSQLSISGVSSSLSNVFKLNPAFSFQCQAYFCFHLQKNLGLVLKTMARKVSEEIIIEKSFSQQVIIWVSLVPQPQFVKECQPVSLGKFLRTPKEMFMYLSSKFNENLSSHFTKCINRLCL